MWLHKIETAALTLQMGDSICQALYLKEIAAFGHVEITTNSASVELNALTEWRAVFAQVQATINLALAELNGLME